MQKKSWLDGKVSHWERKSQVQLFVVVVMLRDSLREMLEAQLEIWDRVPFSLCDGDTMDRCKLRKWDAQRERSWAAQVRTKPSGAPRRWPKTSVERRCRIHPWEARAGRKETRRSKDWGWTLVALSGPGSLGRRVTATLLNVYGTCCLTLMCKVSIMSSSRVKQQEAQRG